MPSDMPQKRSAAGTAEHEQHYSTDDDALAGRALGSTTPAVPDRRDMNRSKTE